MRRAGARGRYTPLQPTKCWSLPSRSQGQPRSVDDQARATGSSARLTGNGITRVTFVRYVRDVDIWVTDLRKEAGSPDSRSKLIDSPGIDRSDLDLVHWTLFLPAKVSL